MGAAQRGDLRRPRSHRYHRHEIDVAHPRLEVGQGDRTRQVQALDQPGGFGIGCNQKVVDPRIDGLRHGGVPDERV
jgi:hypothetical protein